MPSTHIKPNDLRNIGVELDDAELEKIASELSDKVDEGIGTEIVTALTPEDAQTLADMQGKASDEEIGEWIAQRVPDLEDIIEDHRDIVLGDFAENSDLVPSDDTL